MPHRTSLAAVCTLAAAFSIGAAACGSSHKNATNTTLAPATTTPATTAPAATTAPTSAPTATTAAGNNLAGSWTGSYTGAYSGSFHLTWTQTAGTLGGNITISSPASTLPITGTVSGSAIQFGAVGGATYTGTVSGSSMSGSWQLAGTSGGSWNATKS